MTAPQFLFDANLIALGRALQHLYPDEIRVSGDPGVPELDADDPEIYPWCRQHGVILVTFDWDMLRDERILHALSATEGVRVVWIDQVRGEPARKAFLRIIGRWIRIRDALMDNPLTIALVVRGNNQLVHYRRISDAVYEVAVRKKGRRRP